MRCGIAQLNLLELVATQFHEHITAKFGYSRGMGGAPATHWKGQAGCREECRCTGSHRGPTSLPCSWPRASSATPPPLATIIIPWAAPTPRYALRASADSGATPMAPGAASMHRLSRRPRSAKPSAPRLLSAWVPRGSLQMAIATRWPKWERELSRVSDLHGARSLWEPLRWECRR
jgi:hypothetical protein